MARVRQPVRIEPKVWGREIWIANGPLYCGKILEINRGRRCSLHYHKLKSESFYLRRGRLKLKIKESLESDFFEEFEVLPGDCVDITPDLPHQMEALEDAQLYEFSTQHFDSDSYRIVMGG
jgi:mannose-6-phosphate isomerase-like protein (cupin superfamily)